MTKALVTGANSGIGSAIVASLIRRDVHVVATVRSDDAEESLRSALEEVAAGERSLDWSSHLIVERLDVTDADGARRVVERHRPDVVVNNAGHAQLGGVMDVSDDEATAQFDELVIGPTRLTRYAVDALRADGRPGRIINISTMLASTDLPFTGWYSAAKAAFDVVGDALALELGPSDIDVIRIECGAVRTGAWDDAGDEVLAGTDPTTARSRRRWVGLTGLVRPLFGAPQDVGETVARAATSSRPRSVYRVGFASRLGIVADLVPTGVERAVTSRLFGLR